MYKGIGKRLQAQKDDRARGPRKLTTSKRSGKICPDYSNSLFIGNVPKKSNKELRKLLIPYGLRKGPYIIDPPTWKSNPYRIAFANLRKRESVYLAIKELDGTIFMGNKIRVKIARKPR